MQCKWATWGKNKRYHIVRVSNFAKDGMKIQNTFFCGLRWIDKVVLEELDFPQDVTTVAKCKKCFAIYEYWNSK